MNSKKVLKLLIEKKLTITFAESITGGKLSSDFVNNPGASEAYELGLITYSNKMKERFLKVKSSVIERYGVVSKEVVKIMAKGVKSLADADIGVSVSGNAGPTALEKSEVGDVYLAIAIKDQVKAYKLKINKKTRSEIIDEVIKETWEIIYKKLKTI